jgi:hypothetical protein
MVACVCRSAPLVRHVPSQAMPWLAPMPLAACGPQAAAEANLGVVVFLTHKRERAEAILDREGTWRCPKLPVLDRVLNALYAPSKGVATDPSFGEAELIRVAAWLKGEVRRPGPRAPGS